ncbi:MAG: glycosyl transferase [Sphingobacteriales bacterium 50-39]|nr:glycosyltransferase [Sphingobacteriales bacterium]OJW56867.1 MAG: glycosyl transferase [Sphingobacteriales bacterium 50-39]
MKISIITATYNSAATVRDTLVSIQDQRHTDIEHIMVDGRSSDKTLDIVSGFAHVAKIISEKDKGIYDAMNKGIGMATGEVIGILNSDDMYTDDQVLTDVARAFEDPRVMTVYADLQYVNPDNPQRVIRTWRSGLYQKRNFYYGWMPPHPTFFVRKSVYDLAGVFDLSLRSAADYELMLRILLKHGLTAHYIPRVIVKMRAGGMSNASLWNRLRANKEDRLAWKLNGLEPYFFTLYIKPLRKIHQFIIK